MIVEPGGRGDVGIDRRAWLGGVGGAVVALVATAAFGRREAAAGAPAWWVADRDGDAVIGLSRELLPLVRWSVAAPLRVVGGSARGVWVLSAPGRTAEGERRLTRIEVVGGGAREGESRALRPPVDLAGDAPWLLRAGGRALVRRGSDGRWRTRRLARPAGRVVPAPEGEEAVLLSGEGELSLWRASPGGAPERVAAACPARFPLDVAATRDGWWVLDGDGVACWSPDLGSSDLGNPDLGNPDLAREPARAALDGRPGRLVVGPDGCWVLARDGRSARRVSRAPGGELTAGRSFGTGPLRGVRAGAATPRGVLLVAPGALVERDGSGEVLRGQGGFRHLVDVTPARSRAAPPRAGSSRRGSGRPGAPPA